VAGGDLGARGKKVREQDAWLVFEDESGQALRPPKARTWSRIGVPPQVNVSGKGSGRVSVAGMVCAKPGERTRLIYRMAYTTPRDMIQQPHDSRSPSTAANNTQTTTEQPSSD